MSATVAEREVILTIPRPRPHTHPMLLSPARFKVECWGRRAGKSTTAEIACVEGHGPQRELRGVLAGASIGWMAHEFKAALDTWRDLKRMLGGAISKISESEHRLTCYGGGSFSLFTGENADGVRGRGFDGFVMDEAAFQAPENWTECVRPTLADRKGWALIISTPNGMNWFKDLFDRGQDPQFVDWDSRRMPTSSNPDVPESELADLLSLNPLSYRQEYGAEFVVKSGACFSDFARDKHVRDDVELDPMLETHLGVDFGYRTFAAVAFQVDRQGVVRIVGDAEYHDLTTGQSLDRLARESWAQNVTTIGCDPAGDAKNLETGLTDVTLVYDAFPAANVCYSTQPDHRDPEWRASRMRDLLWSAAGNTRMAIARHCAHVIAMLEGSVYPKTHATKTAPVKDGKVDHTRDALGYGLVNTILGGSGLLTPSSFLA